MSDRELPSRPSLEQYKKQARDLARQCEQRSPDALARMRRNHPRFHALPMADAAKAPVSLTDSQLVIAREHGFRAGLNSRSISR